MPSLSSYILPDLFSLSTTFRDATNPFWKRASAESRRWVNSYAVFADRRRAFFFQGQSELLSSHCYPYAGYEQFRTCCDLVNLLFVIDELSDEQCYGDARHTGDIFLRVMRDPTWSDGSKLARMTTDFRARLITTIKPRTFRRFLEHCDAYIDSVVQEAGLRDRGEILKLDEYIHLRRENSAVRVCFGVISYILGIDLPDEVFVDPVFQRIYFSAVDMVCWANDLYSYNMELNSGLEGNNFITVLMETQNMDIQAACDFVGRHYKRLMDDFLSAKASLRSFGPEVDVDVKRYIEACQHWPAGNLVWSFETPRYFGARRDQILRTRIVPLKPLEREPFKEED
ncbi:terpenoid synthase [Multifurca ochricompacta]|uniref:Terpene synthase n=1 Tax=Multifurca ochricompacta TaxID=376703 RepID=A0AAD4QSN1_9AGAM|nr:terpenoid synthase [Multifurca ochricompacta]